MEGVVRHGRTVDLGVLPGAHITPRGLVIPSNICLISLK